MENVRALIGELDEDSFLRAFGDEELENLLKSAVRRDLKRNEEIIRQGDDGDFTVCLLSGRLKVSMVSANGREIILSYAQPGDILGEIALFDRGPRTATVSAIEPAVVLAVPARMVEAAALANPRATVCIMRMMAARIRQLNLLVEGDRAFSMGARLARALVRLMSTEHSEGQLRSSPSQSDLGAFAGMSRENVNRQLAEWEASGLLRRAGRHIELLDPDYFGELAEFGDPE